MIAWLIGFLFTQAIEIPIYMRATTFRVAFLASAFTHPIVWFVFPAFWPGGYGSMVAGAELFAWAAEALWLKANGVERAGLWSFIANAGSFCIGMALRSCFGVP
jgi:hypothetical protein